MPREANPVARSAADRRRTRLAVFAGAAVVLSALAVFHSEIGAGMSRGIQVCRDAGPLPFFAAMAVLPAVGFPLSPFIVMAEPVFGPALGTGRVAADAIVALAANATLSYAAARGLLRPLAAKLVDRMGYRLPEMGSGGAWELTLLVRIVPGPPVFIQGWLLGLARTPFGIYLTVSTLVQSAYLAGLFFLGDALKSGDRLDLLVPLGIFLAVGLAMHRLRKRLLGRKALT
jgi:uncharacterized membrane protein YdjX (TVP38/TMEM64 family)